MFIFENDAGFYCYSQYCCTVVSYNPFCASKLDKSFYTTWGIYWVVGNESTSTKQEY